MAVAKRQRQEKPVKIKKEGLQTGVRTLGKTDNSPGYPNFHRAGSEGRRQVYKRRKPRIGASLLSALFGPLALRSRGCIFLCLSIKWSYNTGLSVASNFCCGKTEPRKLHTPPTLYNRKF